MNLSCTLHNAARQFPTRPAITWDGGALSYGEFERQAACIAGALRGRHGLPRGTRVALAMENCPEFLPALYGTWRAGLSAGCSWARKVGLSCSPTSGSYPFLLAALIA